MDSNKLIHVDSFKRTKTRLTRFLKGLKVVYLDSKNENKEIKKAINIKIRTNWCYFVNLYQKESKENLIKEN